MIKRKYQHFLSELDLQKCGLTNDSLLVLSKLIASKFKLRILNLKNNGVGDDSAHQILSAVKQNTYITKIKLDMNPAASAMIGEIEVVLN